jgi:ACR3 family arsenite efflux pump ArsB
VNADKAGSVKARLSRLDRYLPEWFLLAMLAGLLRGHQESSIEAALDAVPLGRTSLLPAWGLGAALRTGLATENGTFSMAAIAIAVRLGRWGVSCRQALAGVIGPLIEVPVGFRWCPCATGELQRRDAPRLDPTVAAGPF